MEPRNNLVVACREPTIHGEAQRAALELAAQRSRIALGDGVTDDACNAAVERCDEDQPVALISQIAVIKALDRVSVMTQQPGGHSRLPIASQRNAEAVPAS